LTTERVSWEDFKKQQKEAAGIEAAAAADEAEQMLKYRAQLDADRAAKLAKVLSSVGMWCTANARSSSCPSSQCCSITLCMLQGTNHAHFREPADKRADKKRKHADDGEDSRHGKEKRSKKEKKHKDQRKKDGKKKSRRAEKDRDPDQ